MKRFYVYILILGVLYNVNALDFDTSVDSYKTNFISDNEIIKLSDGVFERKLEILRMTNENILLKQDNNEVLLIEIKKSRKMDLNDDGFYDMEISFNSFENERAEIGLIKLSEKPLEAKNNNENKIDNTTKYLIVLVVFLFILYLIKKWKNRKYY